MAPDQLSSRGKPGDPIDAADLLHAYAAVLTIVRDPPASLTFPRGGLVQRLHPGP